MFRSRMVSKARIPFTASMISHSFPSMSAGMARFISESSAIRMVYLSGGRLFVIFFSPYSVSTFKSPMRKEGHGLAARRLRRRFLWYLFYNYKRSALRIQPISLSLQTVSHIPRAYRPIPAPILLKMRTHDVSQPHASPNVSHGARPLLPDYRSQTPNAAAAMKLLCTSACGIRALLHFSTLIESFYRPYRTCSKAG